MVQKNCARCQNVCVWCNIIVLEVSCKHHLPWWIMPFVVAPGIRFTDPWDFIRLFILCASTFFMIEPPTIRIFSLALSCLILLWTVLLFDTFCWSFCLLVSCKVVLSVTFFFYDALFILLYVALLLLDLVGFLRFQFTYLNFALC